MYVEKLSKKPSCVLEAKSNRQAEIKMQAGMSSMLIIAWRMSCSQILRELHFVICVGDLMFVLLQYFFFFFILIHNTMHRT